MRLNQRVGFACVALLIFSTVAFAEPATAPSVARAEAQATLASTIAGTIEDLPFAEGSEFAKGDVLARFNCELYSAEAKALRAELQAAESRSSALEQLLERGAAGRAEVQATKALALAATANLETAEVRMKGCTITAPFDGKIIEYTANAFEYVQPSQPLVSVVSFGKPELEIIAPDTWLLWIAKGTTGQVQFEAAVGTFDIVITGIAPIVDPVSQTVKLLAAFQGDASAVLPGMSGLVRFEAIP